jgi:predicted porin
MRPQRFVPLILLAALSPASKAQTVQIYGVVDAGITHVTGLAGSPKNFLVTGVMDGSRLGFKGQEDLGGKFRAFFTLESRLELDSGGVSNRPFSESQVPDRLSQASLLGLPSTLQPAVTGVASSLGNTLGVNLTQAYWDRQIYVGLGMPVGAILAGRQYTPAYEVAAAFDTTRTQSALSSGQVGTIPAVIDIRISNSAAYRLELGPLSAVAMVAPSEGSGTSGNFRGISLVYKAGSVAAGLGYNRRNNEQGQKSLSTTVLGASFNAGPGTFVTSFDLIKDPNPSALSGIATGLASSGVPVAAAQAVQNAYIQGLKQDSRIWHLGYRLSAEPHAFYAAFTRLFDKTPAHADVRSYGGGYTYAFSKRTDVNLILVRFDNFNLAQAAPGQAGMIGGVTASAGKGSSSFTLGIRHRF